MEWEDQRLAPIVIHPEPMVHSHKARIWIDAELDIRQRRIAPEVVDSTLRDQDAIHACAVHVQPAAHWRQPWCGRQREVDDDGPAGRVRVVGIAQAFKDGARAAAAYDEQLTPTSDTWTRRRWRWSRHSHLCMYRG